jgi:hypothetical protein
VTKADFGKGNTVISIFPVKMAGHFGTSRNCSALMASLTHLRTDTLTRGFHVVAAGALPAMVIARSTHESVYSVLWALVFAFATLNILSLGARRLDRTRGGLSFGEVLAILIVLVSMVLLAWELLYVFHILPIQLAPR